MAVTASDAASRELRREEQEEGEAAPEGKQQRCQSSARHRRQAGGVCSWPGERETPLSLHHSLGSSQLGSANPRPSPPSLTPSATQVAEDQGTEGPILTLQKLPTH